MAFTRNIVNVWIQRHLLENVSIQCVRQTIFQIPVFRKIDNNVFALKSDSFSLPNVKEVLDFNYIEN